MTHHQNQDVDALADDLIRRGDRPVAGQTMIDLVRAYAAKNLRKMRTDMAIDAVCYEASKVITRHDRGSNV